MRLDQSMKQKRNNNMVKKIQNFGNLYGEKIYPANGLIYTIEKANIVRTHSEPELLEYFDIKLLDMYNNPKPAEYSIGIFADNRNGYNLACVYKRGESSSVFTDKVISPSNFRRMEIFKTYVVTLINKVI